MVSSSRTPGSASWLAALRAADERDAAGGGLAAAGRSVPVARDQDQKLAADGLEGVERHIVFVGIAGFGGRHGGGGVRRARARCVPAARRRVRRRAWRRGRSRT